MKKVISAFLLIVIICGGCVSNQKCLDSGDNCKAIELAILWEAKLDEAWTPVEMGRLVSDKKLFKEEGVFFKAKREVIVFGHPVSYVGMVGVEFCGGPNAFLQGDPKDIAKNITDRYGITLQSKDGNYFCDLKKHIQLIITRNPNNKNESIIIGSYTGP